MLLVEGEVEVDLSEPHGRRVGEGWPQRKVFPGKEDDMSVNRKQQFIKHS